MIRYEAVNSGSVRLQVHVLNEQRVRSMVDRIRPSGGHEMFQWDEAGYPVTREAYLCRLGACP